ncbi:MAG: DUF1499 domain-containing protein [Tissierellales bacterium]|jgi:uncharacterized protein (DUF1499 family)|nr:DUF1499 domain-containing protein [Tissierellales bacterium]
MKLKIVLIILGIIVCLMFIKNNTMPRNLGVNNGKLAKMPSSPNAVSSQAKTEEKQVAPLLYIEDKSKSKLKIESIIGEYQSAEIITNTENYIHVVFSTSKMRFKDDVEFYFDDENKVVHYRSASRIGYSDMGMNRARYDEVADKYGN